MNFNPGYGSYIVMKPTCLTLKLEKAKITKTLLKDHTIFNPRKAIHLIRSFQWKRRIQ